jgi:hypothetical protein
MPVPEFAAILAVLVLVVSVRMYAARRVAAGRSGYVWFLFGPGLLSGAAVIWVGACLFARQPQMAAFMVVVGSGLLALAFRTLRRMSQAVGSAASFDDRVEAVIGPLVDYVLAVVGVILIGGLVALVGLLVWGVMQAAA